MAAFTLNTIFRAVDKFSAPFKVMNNSITSFENKVSRGFSKVNRALGGFGIAAGGAGLFMVGKQIIGIFSEFEQANANLSSVLNKSRAETVLLSNDAKRLGAITAFTASQVTGLQTAYAKLGFSQDEILKSTAPTLALAAATNTDLSQAATQVGAALRAFGLDASKTSRITDAFAASTSMSALDMEKLNVSMSTVAPVAKQFGFQVEDTLALLGKLSDAGFDASTAATSTRNILLNLADSSGALAKSLGRPVKTLPDLVDGLKELKGRGVDLASMLNLTDKRSVAAFATFLDGADSIKVLADQLYNAGGFADKMAKEQLNTLTGRVTIMKSAWEGWVLSLEDGNGKFARTLKNVVEVAAEILSLAGGFEKVNDQLTEHEKKIRHVANMGLRLLGVIKFLVKSYVLWKAATIAIRVHTALTLAATKAYNAVLMVQTLTQNGLTGSMWKLIASQWQLNAAMTANPIGLIVLGVMALIAGIVLLIIYWDKVKAKINEWSKSAIWQILSILNPIMKLIEFIAFMSERWTAIKNIFREGGFVEGIKAIGKSILSFILKPLEIILGAIAKITGFDWAKNASNSIAGFRENLDFGMVEGKEVKPFNYRAEESKAQTSRMEEIMNGNLNVNLTNRTDKNVSVTSSGVLTPKVAIN